MSAGPDPTALCQLVRSRAALVLVDYQQRLLPAIHHGSEVLAQALKLADLAQLTGVPVIGTEQNPQGLGPNVEPIRTRCATTLAKMHFDACADGLLAALEGKSDVLIAGCEAHVCLMQTALGLLRIGRRVWVAADACGSRRATEHALAMQRLHAAGAVVGSVEMLAFEGLQGCEDAAFGAVLARLKQG